MQLCIRLVKMYIFCFGNNSQVVIKTENDFKYRDAQIKAVIF